MPSGSAAGRNPAVAIVLALVAFLGGMAAANDDEPDDTTSATSATGPRGKDHERRRNSEPDDRERDRGGRHDDRRQRPPAPAPSSSSTPEPPEPSTFLVMRVVDGDTLELGNGQTVRLAGIDTPEVGECGFEQSSAALGDLVLGRQVTLGESDEDVDQYGRLLRYVDVGPVDAGLALIERGLATARYDSRDGYGYHPREDTYVQADSVSRDVSCRPPAQPVPLVGGGGCAPGYSPCIPPSPPDLDCPDVDGPIKVTGDDPHGLDADNDGWACES